MSASIALFSQSADCFVGGLWVKAELHMPDSVRAMKMNSEPSAILLPTQLLPNRPWIKFAQAPHQRKETGMLKPNQAACEPP